MHAQRLPKSLHTFTVQAETGNGTTEKESCFIIPLDLWVYWSPSANGDRRWNSRWKVMQEQSLNSGYGNVSSEAKRKAEEQKRSLLLFLRFMDCMKMRWTRQGLAGAILSVSPSEVLLLVACSTRPGVQNSNSDKLERIQGRATRLTSGLENNFNMRFQLLHPFGERRIKRWPGYSNKVPMAIKASLSGR